LPVFSGGESWTDLAKDVALGGISAAAGLYIYNRFIGQPLTNAFKMAGSYAGVVAAAVAALALDYVGARIGSETVARGFEVAGYAILGLSLKNLIPGDPPVMVPSSSSATKVSMSAFQGLSPVPLAHEVI